MDRILGAPFLAQDHVATDPGELANLMENANLCLAGGDDLDAFGKADAGSAAAEYLMRSLVDPRE